MDNFNALSKSAILTKLALDGYFIDLLTLNSFIKDWQIEAIYENEFGIEFFDNNSYLTILDKLKAKYNKTKKRIEEPKVKEPEIKEEPKVQSENIEKPAESKIVEPSSSAPVAVQTSAPASVPVSPSVSESKPVQELPKPASVPVHDEPNAENKEEYSSISLEELVETFEQDAAKEKTAPQMQNIAPSKPAPTVDDTLEVEYIEYIEEPIMPIAMKNLKPGPVSPNSNIVVDHSYTEPDVRYKAENNLDDLIVEEKFSVDDIEKANELIHNASQKPLPESITETYFDTKTYETNVKDVENIPAAKKEPEQRAETKQAKPDEMDLMQLAQSFAQNFTGGDTKDVPPADLEQIFADANSYTDTFSELQDYVKDEPEEYESLQEDLPSDIMVPEVPKEATHFDSALVSSNNSNLNADDIRNIIREEITRQTASIVPVPQNNENVKEILREIVKQTADVVPQNAFKLDISQGTLDMIAKTIAKKIAIKLNSYYKLNSSKQNEKLELFRQRTIELKEKNQMLAEENRKLKQRLFDADSDLASYKPSIFGLFKYTGNKRRR